MTVIEEADPVVAVETRRFPADQQLGDQVILVRGCPVGKFTYPDSNLAGLIVGNLVAIAEERLVWVGLDGQPGKEGRRRGQITSD